MGRIAFGLVAPTVIVTLVAAPAAVGQGDNGFLRGRGKLGAAYTYEADSFDHFWVGSTKVKDPAVGELTRESGNLWVAYGLTDEFDLVVNASYVDAENDGTAPFSDERALQDGTVGAKWRIFEQRLGPGAFSLLAAPAVKIPLSHYEADSVTAIGDGQIDYRGRAIAHYLFDFGAFVAVESGFDYRTEGPANEIPFHASVGATFFDRLTITPFYDYVDSRDGEDIGQAPFPDVEEDIERWGVSLFLRCTQNLGVTGGWKDTIDGRNTGDLSGWWVGLVLSF